MCLYSQQSGRRRRRRKGKLKHRLIARLNSSKKIQWWKFHHVNKVFLFLSCFKATTQKDCVRDIKYEKLITLQCSNRKNENEMVKIAENKSKEDRLTLDAKSVTFCWRFRSIFDCSDSFVSSSETSGLQMNFESWNRMLLHLVIEETKNWQIIPYLAVFIEGITDIFPF